MGKCLILLGICLGAPTRAETPSDGWTALDTLFAVLLADAGMVAGAFGGAHLGVAVDPPDPDVAFSGGGILGLFGGTLVGGTLGVHLYGRAQGWDGHAVAATGGVLLGLVGAGFLCALDSDELCFVGLVTVPGWLGATFWRLSRGTIAPQPGDVGPPFEHVPNVGVPRLFLRPGPAGDWHGGLGWHGTF